MLAVQTAAPLRVSRNVQYTLASLYRYGLCMSRFSVRAGAGLLPPYLRMYVHIAATVAVVSEVVLRIEGSLYPSGSLSV